MSDSGSPRRRGLGRGLEVLIGPVGHGDELTQLPVGAIKPNRHQPRRHLDPARVEGLAESIRAQGVVQPVLVRASPDGGYELIAGERRWRAAKAAGLPTIPALVRDVEDRESLLLALAENVARENLSPADEARAYAALMDEFGLSLGEVAEHVGRSKSSVSNRIRLLELPDDVLTLVDRGELSEGHARAVLGVPDHEERRRLARQIVKQGLSVRAAERAARSSGARTKIRRTAAAQADPHLVEQARSALARLTGAEVRARPGRLEILYADETELAELAEALTTALAGPELREPGAGSGYHAALSGD